jgi:hypothetical protein
MNRQLEFGRFKYSPNVRLEHLIFTQQASSMRCPLSLVTPGRKGADWVSLRPRCDAVGVSAQVGSLSNAFVPGGN